MSEAEDKEKGMEGRGLLGSPTFTSLPNGRLKCVETGHELVPTDKDSYSNSKRCRIGLIDFALSNNKPPLNMFKPHPLVPSKLICKLTGDTVNKSEEHIWKHINGKRFLHKLEQKETEKLGSGGLKAGEDEKKQEKPKSDTNRVKKKKKKTKEKKGKTKEEIISEIRNSSDKDSDSEGGDFWVPPVGERWDFDDGGDRWGSDGESEPEQENEEENGAVEDNGKASEELSTRTKRMSIEIGPSSFAPRKKKSKKNQHSIPKLQKQKEKVEEEEKIQN